MPVEVGEVPVLAQEDCERVIELCAQLRAKADATIANLTAEHGRHYAVPVEKDPTQEFADDNASYFKAVRREREAEQEAADRMAALQAEMTPEKRQEILAAVS